MYKVTKGIIQHKGEFYRKGKELPETFTNKEGYRNVEWCGKGDAPTNGDQADAEIKKLRAENEQLKAENEQLKKAAKKADK